MFPLHDGLPYSQFLKTLIQKRGVRSYLEIGVEHGVNLSEIKCDTVIGVDPNLQIRNNIADGKKSVFLFNMSSDAFFASRQLQRLVPDGVDFAFLDGMHLFEYLLRDIYKTEACCHENSVIAIHDCLPLNVEMAERSYAPEKRTDESYKNWWTGDVWKAVMILRKYRPDMIALALNCPPTGLVLLSNLDPKNTILKTHYHSMVDEFVARPNNNGAIAEFYQSLRTVSTREMLSGSDHSLYLKL